MAWRQYHENSVIKPYKIAAVTSGSNMYTKEMKLKKKPDETSIDTEKPEMKKVLSKKMVCNDRDGERLGKILHSVENKPLFLVDFAYHALEYCFVTNPATICYVCVYIWYGETLWRRECTLCVCVLICNKKVLSHILTWVCLMTVLTFYLYIRVNMLWQILEGPLIVYKGCMNSQWNLLVKGVGSGFTGSTVELGFDLCDLDLWPLT